MTCCFQVRRENQNRRRSRRQGPDAYYPVLIQYGLSRRRSTVVSSRNRSPSSRRSRSCPRSSRR